MKEGQNEENKQFSVASFYWIYVLCSIMLEI